MYNHLLWQGLQPEEKPLSLVLCLLQPWHCTARGGARCSHLRMHIRCRDRSDWVSPDIPSYDGTSSTLFADTPFAASHSGHQTTTPSSGSANRPPPPATRSPCTPAMSSGPTTPLTLRRCTHSPRTSARGIRSRTARPARRAGRRALNLCGSMRSCCRGDSDARRSRKAQRKETTLCRSSLVVWGRAGVLERPLLRATSEPLPHLPMMFWTCSDVNA